MIGDYAVLRYDYYTGNSNDTAITLGATDRLRIISDDGGNRLRDIVVEIETPCRYHGRQVKVKAFAIREYFSCR